MQRSLRTSSMIWGKFTPIMALFAALVLAGCSATTSSTSGYTGTKISVYEAKQDEAETTVKQLRKDLRKAQRALEKLEKREARDARQLQRKKLSDKRRTQIEARVEERKSLLKTARRDLKTAEKALARAERTERRAQRRLETALRRKEAAERRQAAAKKREAERQAALKKKKEEAAESSTSAFGGGLFGRSDPATKYISDYRGRSDGGFKVVEIPTDKIDKRLLRQQVRYKTRHRVGTIVVDTKAKYLYLVQPGGKAMRYGIGVGKAGFEWSGAAHIGWKQKWPKWTPPNEMIARRPSLRKWSAKNGGMPGGPKNPLGARALYLMQGGVDTLYRLHGTPEWKSIGTAASSGCIRLMNQDIIDLYKRVPQGTKVVVL